ncbi:UNVERIFIED_ORG: hypothetical protein GGE44_001035 [Rhizobium esperanzae]
MLHQEFERLLLEVGAGFNAEPVHLFGRRRPHPMEFLDGKCFDEGRPVLRRNDGLAIGLVEVARHLGEELVVGNTGRCVETGDLLDPGADLQRNLGGDFHALQIVRDVEIGLVERQRLNERRVFGKDLADLLRHGFVEVEAWRHEDQVRTFSFRGDRGHRRVDAEFAGLIARRRNHPTRRRSPDGDRFAAQFRVIALLDRRIKRVHVDMDDLARPLVTFIICHDWLPSGPSVSSRHGKCAPHLSPSGVCMRSQPMAIRRRSTAKLTPAPNAFTNRLRSIAPWRSHRRQMNSITGSR